MLLHSMCFLVLLLFGSKSVKLEKIEIVPKIPNVVEYGTNEICLLESKIYKENLKNFTLWAHKMLDSSSKSNFGILRENSYQLGNYEECINIEGPFPIQYCLISLTIKVPIGNETVSYSRSHDPYGSFFSNLQKPGHKRIQQQNVIRIALCLPASCLTKDIEYSLTEHLRNSKKPFEREGVTYAVAVSGDLCTSNSTPKDFGKLDIVFCACSAIMLFLVILGSVISDSPSKTMVKLTFRRKFCLSFSVIKNFKSLFRPHENHEGTQIFDGLRTIILLLVIFGHKVVNTSTSPWINPYLIDENANTRTGLLFEKLDLTITTFFVISGLMLSYGILKKLKNVKINPFLVILLRYIRLTPLNAYVCFFMMTILNFCGSGPVWNSNVQPLIGNCRKHMWMTVLYINTVFSKVELFCNPVTWFISNDFQLFVIGTLIIFVIRWKKRLGYAILGFYFLFSIITPLTLTLVYKIPPISGLEYNDHATKLYLMPYDHASAYIVGIFGGILYHHLKCNDIKISKVLTYSIIATSSFFMVLVLGYLPLFYHGLKNYNAIESALFNSLHRFVWAVSILGIFVVTSFGSATSLRRSLSSTFWIPLSKLSYGIFLTHTTQIIISASNIRSVIYISPFYLVSTLVADIIIVIFISFLLYLCVEIPIMKMFKYTFLPKLYHLQEAEETMKLETLEELQNENNSCEETNEK